MSDALAKTLVLQNAVRGALVEEALQRQVVHGGSLDTNLLELGAIDEARLVELMSETFGLPAAGADEIEAIAEHIPRLFPQLFAETYHLVPYRLVGQNLGVLVNRPAEPALFARIEERLRLFVKPAVTTEARLHFAMNRLYGVELQPRYRELLGRLGEKNLPSQAQKDGGPGHVLSWGLGSAPSGAPRPNERQKLTVSSLLGRLAAANDRDAIIDVLLEAALSTFEFAALFQVHGEQINGWRGMDPETTQRVARISLPVELPSVFQTIYATHGHYLGPLPANSVNTRLIEDLAREPPRTALLAPLLVGGKLAGILFADNGARGVASKRVAAILLLTHRAGMCLEELIRRRKSTAESLVRDEGLPSRAPETPTELGDEDFEPISEGPLIFAPPPPSRPASTPLAPLLSSPPSRADEPVTIPVMPPPLPPPLPRTVAAPVEVEQPVATLPVTEEAPTAEVTPPPAAEEPANAGLEPPPTAEEAATAEFEPPPAAEEPATAKPAPPPAAEGPTTAELEPPPSLASPAEPPTSAVPIPADETEEPEEEEPTPQSGLWQSVQLESLDTDGVTGQFLQDQSPAAATEAFARSAESSATAEPETIELGFEPPVEEESPAEKPYIAFAEVDAETPAQRVGGWEDVFVETVGTDRAILSEEPPAQITGAPPAVTWDDVIAEAEAAPALSVAPKGAVEVAGQVVDERAMLLDSLDAGDPEVWRGAIERLLPLGSALDAELGQRFPGQLNFDPFRPGTRLPPFSQCTGVTALLAARAAAGAPVALPFLESNDPIKRLFAIYFLYAVPYPAALELLARRLYDAEPRNRLHAADALRTYRQEAGYRRIIQGLRDHLKVPVFEAQVATVQVLGQLRDPSAVPSLIPLVISPRPALARASASALTVICGQAFGQEVARWADWWQHHFNKPREAWLVEGMRHPDANVRRIAAREFQLLTGHAGPSESGVTPERSDQTASA